MRVRRRGLRVAGALAVGLAMLLGVVPAGARTDNRTKSFIMVHGLDAFGCAGVDGTSTWGDMITALTNWGWTGSKVKIGYYECDSNMSHSINHHGSHATHYGGNGEHYTASEDTHGADTRIEHLGYHLMWYIKDHFGGTCIDAVGHSMGGLMLRYGLARVQAGNSSFPTGVCIEDALTYGTPHTGTSWAYGCEWADQCDQMEPGDAFQTWLASNAANPQGAGGTDWTVIAADDDTVVSVASGMGMSATHKTRYLGANNIEHSDYMHDRLDDARTADVEYWDSPGPWYSWYDAPWPLRWGDQALYLGTW